MTKIEMANIKKYIFLTVNSFERLTDSMIGFIRAYL